MKLKMLLLGGLACAGMLACKSESQPSEQAPAPTAAKGPAPAPMQRAQVRGGAPGSQPVGQAPGSQPTGGMPPGHPPTGGMPPGHPPTGEMPPGHPPTGGMPPGHPPTGEMPPGHPPTGGMPPGHPPMGGGGGAAHPGGAVDTPPAGPGYIGGTLELSKDLADKIKPNSVLFIMVRRDEGEGKRGMMLAAQKLPVKADTFPLKYRVTSLDVMMQGTALAGVVRLEARIDQDGDAISKTPGDIVGRAHGAHQVGSMVVDFKLDEVL